MSDQVQLPLQGIRVIDLTQYAPGPYATRLLCDLGAEIIKIEPIQGDPMRRLFVAPGGGDSAVYRHLNDGKQIARLNLKQPSVIAALKPLLKTADVLLESFRPGVMKKLGLDWTHCRQHNSKLVYASLSGYGQEGPYRDKAGHDINYLAAAGAFSFDEHPRPRLPLIADHSGAVNAVNGILAALLSAGRDGRGHYLDLSLYEPVLGWQYLANSTMQNAENDELALLNGGAACYNIYRTADDRFVTLGALEAKFWQNFCIAIEQNPWVERQFEPSPQARLIADMQTLFGKYPLSHWINKLKDCDCCFEPIPLPTEIPQHKQTRYRDQYRHDSVSYPGMLDGHNLQTTMQSLELAKDVIPHWRN